MAKLIKTKSIEETLRDSANKLRFTVEKNSPALESALPVNYYCGMKLDVSN